MAAGLTLSTKGMRSSSTEIRPLISPSSSNTSSLTASKHLGAQKRACIRGAVCLDSHRGAFS